MSRKGRVLVAMSGGVDSSVVAMLLHDQGYDVIGITMKTWDYASSGGSVKETGCCSLDSINDARIVAVELGFPHYILDIRSEFGDYVIDNFVDEYIAGRTPNPCVLCNTHIKWEALLKRADALDCEYIATGHYAKINNANGRYYVSKGKDPKKDQSYVLWGLSQDSLSRSMFPLNDYSKEDIKEMAIEFGFENIARKSESFEICFIPDNDYRGFLKRRVKGLEERVNGGDFILNDGTIVGKHKGYPFYTIGQRKGLEVALGKPMYVTNIKAESNTVVIGEEHELKKNKMLVHKINISKYPGIPEGVEVLTKVRHHDKGRESQLFSDDSNNIMVNFYGDVKGIAPGQSAVFYEGADVIGGGIIHSGI